VTATLKGGCHIVYFCERRLYGAEAWKDEPFERPQYTPSIPRPHMSALPSWFRSGNWIVFQYEAVFQPLASLKLLSHRLTAASGAQVLSAGGTTTGQDQAQQAPAQPLEMVLRLTWVLKAFPLPGSSPQAPSRKKGRPMTARTKTPTYLDQNPFIWTCLMFSGS